MPQQRYRGPDRRKPILIVQHAMHEHPAAVRRVLESQGILTQWIHPYRGELYPEASSLRGMISMGGPMSANDEADHAWIASEIRLMREVVDLELPMVGICLGGQMLARALGGRVERNPTNEVGWFELTLNPAGLADPVLGVAGESPAVYHWHGDTFFPPDGAIHLARSKACERQAYRYGENAYGFQFHPEADHQLVHEWLEVGGVEQEISEAQRVHGKMDVQDARTQKSLALQCERASLKITAAIGNLFREREKGPTKRGITEIRPFFTGKPELVIEFEGSDRKSVRLRGHISNLVKIASGDYVMFREENRLLWPIRIEDVLSIRKVAK